MKILVLYLSHDGQTRAIAQRIATLLTQEMAIDCDLKDLALLTSPLMEEEYQGVIIGAAIRYGHFPSHLDKFTKQYVTWLNSIPSAFFSVNLTARKPQKCSPQTNGYTRKFLQATPWHPTLCRVFAGALRYPRYSWFDRVMIQFIMWLTHGETDTSKEVEYTDWQAVTTFSQEIQQILLSR